MRPKSSPSYLVDHHNSQQVADRSEEKAVQVVLNSVADGGAEDIHDDLANDEEEDAKDNVTDWPAILERSKDQENLTSKVDGKADGVDDVGDHEDTDRVLVAQTSPVLEGEQGHSTADDEHGERTESEQPDREGGTVLVKLESDEAVDEQTGA